MHASIFHVKQRPKGKSKDKKGRKDKGKGKTNMSSRYESAEIKDQREGSCQICGRRVISDMEWNLTGRCGRVVILTVSETDREVPTAGGQMWATSSLEMGALEPVDENPCLSAISRGRGEDEPGHRCSIHDIPS